MVYKELYNTLKAGFENINRGAAVYPEPGIKITKHNFSSSGTGILPGAASYICNEHNISFPAEDSSVEEELLCLNKLDFSIDANHHFNFYVVQNTGSSAQEVVFLFHGLNEKKWHKYLPWAYYITKQTGMAVILFPTAFHMDRTDELWSDSRMMRTISLHRAARVNNTDCSFVNAAISTRLEASPDRIFWSGYQTYMDFVEMIKLIRSSGIKGVSKDSSIDLFGYSIGAFLSLIIMMANPGNEMSCSRFFAFCGGATLDRMFPVSKYILDLKASIAIQSYFAEQTNTNFKNNARLEHYLGGRHREPGWFSTMLRYKHQKEKRETRIREICTRVHAVALERDTVVPPEEVLNTLCGAYRNINTAVEVLDFPYEYDHINPFPLGDKYKTESDIAFRSVMDKACSFLG